MVDEEAEFPLAVRIDAGSAIQLRQPDADAELARVLHHPVPEQRDAHVIQVLLAGVLGVPQAGIRHRDVVVSAGVPDFTPRGKVRRATLPFHGDLVADRQLVRRPEGIVQIQHGAAPVAILRRRIDREGIEVHLIQCRRRLDCFQPDGAPDSARHRPTEDIPAKGSGRLAQGQGGVTVVEGACRRGNGTLLRHHHGRQYVNHDLIAGRSEVAERHIPRDEHIVARGCLLAVDIHLCHRVDALEVQQQPVGAVRGRIEGCHIEQVPVLQLPQVNDIGTEKRVWNQSRAEQVEFKVAGHGRGHRDSPLYGCGCCRGGQVGGTRQVIAAGCQRTPEPMGQNGQ